MTSGEMLLGNAMRNFLHDIVPADLPCNRVSNSRILPWCKIYPFLRKRAPLLEKTTSQNSIRFPKSRSPIRQGFNFIITIRVYHSGIVGGAKNIQKFLRNAFYIAVVGFNQNSAILQKPGRLCLKNRILGTIYVAENKTSLSQNLRQHFFNTKFTVNLNPIRHCICQCELECKFSGFFGCVKGKHLCFCALDSKTHSIVTFGAAYINDNLRGLVDNFLHYRVNL